MNDEEWETERRRIAQRARIEAARLAQQRVARGPDAVAPGNEKGTGVEDETPGTGADNDRSQMEKPNARQ